MLEFSKFDRRGYPTVSVREGYCEWFPSYEATVEDEMDIVLLEALESVPWTAVARAADLGCGTGRTGAWLRSRGVARIDGIDLTPEMLARARARGIYDRLELADVAATGLDGAVYDLVTTCLVDEHLADLRPLYREVSRLARPGGWHVRRLSPVFHHARRDGDSLQSPAWRADRDRDVRPPPERSRGRRTCGGAHARQDAGAAHRRPVDRAEAPMGRVPPSPGELHYGLAPGVIAARPRAGPTADREAAGGAGRRTD
jgi:SAM-dependent methyltransferase